MVRAASPSLTWCSSAQGWGHRLWEPQNHLQSLGCCELSTSGSNQGNEPWTAALGVAPVGSAPPALPLPNPPGAVQRANPNPLAGSAGRLGRRAQLLAGKVSGSLPAVPS